MARLNASGLPINAQDLRGQVFNGWHPVGYFARSRWICQCHNCPAMALHSAIQLTRHVVRRCPCVNYAKIMNTKFDRLTPVFYLGCRRWRLRCSCGNEHEALIDNLISRGVRSCGCLRLKGNPTHGMRRWPEYKVWRSMKERCTNEKHPGFDKWGGRGIRVCARWIDSFENFIADMGRRPSHLHSIDRYPDMNGNYEPGNCRWATWEEQQNNRRNSRLYTLDGLTLSIHQWSRETGIPAPTLWGRINRHGWTLERALTTPPRFV